MIRGDRLFGAEAFDEIDARLETFPARFRDALRTMFFSDIAPGLLTELRHTPGPVKYPLEWASERQRRAFFATDGFGRGIPYERTGRTNSLWVVNIDLFDGAVVMTTSNSSKAARFTVGRRQQPFHRNTGWQPAKPKIDYWNEQARDMAKALLREQARMILRGA